jgi:glycosyltransferase involved in cell wall biosynthesis
MLRPRRCVICSNRLSMKPTSTQLGALPLVSASTWGPPRESSTYSGIPYTVFSNLHRRGGLVGEFNQKPGALKSILWHRYRFGALFSPRSSFLARSIWRYLPANIERVRREHRRSGAVDGAEVIFQFGVAGTHTAGLPLLAHIEYPIAFAINDPVFSVSYGFAGLSDQIKAAAIEGERQFTDSCDLIWTNSAWTAALHHQSGVDPKKIRIITPPGNFQELGKTERDWSQRNILFVGRNWTVKGGDHLVSAFKIVRERMQDATLTIIGCEPPPAVRDEDGVNCLGYLSMDDPSERNRLIEAYSAATVFCMPSRLESTGMVFMEAAASGLPVIMRRIPQTDDLYPDALFPKVEDSSPEPLAELLLLDLEAGPAVINRASAARKFVESNYGLDIFLQKIDGLLKETVSRVSI